MPLPPIMPGKPLEERPELTPEQKRRKVAEIKTALGRAALRRAWYLEQGKSRDAEIQDDIIDRRLRELFEYLPPLPAVAP